MRSAVSIARRMLAVAASILRRVLLIVLAVVASVALAKLARPPAAEIDGATPMAPVKAGAASAGWLAHAQREIAASEYRASRTSAGLQAPNRAHALRTWFEPTGICVHDRTATESSRLAELRLVALGRDDAGLSAVTPGEVVSRGSRVEIRRPGLVEWYENTPAGLEQGFTLERPPAGAGSLVLELDVAGARVRIEGDAVVLASTGGRELRYGKLEVRDAAGAVQTARLEAPSASRVRLVIDAAGAAYPLVVDPLITGFAAEQLESNQSNAFLGASVAGAGDVNGDGYDDVIVGADVYDAGEAEEGAAFVFLGGVAGVASSSVARIESNQSNAVLGRSVAGAGDVNGDGYGDVIVGAIGYDAGESDEGAAFVFLGSAAGIAGANPATAAAQIESNDPGAFLGRRVAGAGDVNGDGYDDIVVVAGFDGVVGGGESAAFLFLGSAAGIADGNPDSAAGQIESSGAAGEFGDSVAGVGDVNGDGYDDVVVGAPWYTAGQSGEGAAFVFLGSATGIADGNPATAAAQLESNSPNAHLGWSVAGAGDVNGDGYADVVVGAPEYPALPPDSGPRMGAAFVFLGSASGIADGNPATAAARLESDLSNPRLGWSVAGAGDVNGDGYDDVIVGAPDSHAFFVYYAGAAFVFLGSAAGIADGSPATAAARLQSKQADAAFGYAVAGAGDVNGDGYADVIAGAPYYGDGEDFEGAAFVFHGRTCQNAADDDGDGLADFPGDPGCQSAADLSERGDECDDGVDVDGDGYADFPSDPGCTDLADDYERGTAVCDNLIEEDGDGRTSYPTDPGCADVADTSERGTTACDNGVDDDGDQRVDYNVFYSESSDPGCTDPADSSELGTAACDNGVDDDGDGLSDSPSDPGCGTPASTRENPQCQDGLNNDGQTGIDFDGGASLNGGVPIAAPDPQCTAAWKNRESASGCGLGFELALVLPTLLWLRGRRNAPGRAGSDARRSLLTRAPTRHRGRPGPRPRPT